MFSLQLTLLSLLMYLFTQVVTDLAPRTQHRATSLLFTETLSHQHLREDLQSASLTMLQIFHFQSLKILTQLQRAQPLVSSGVLVLTVLLVLTRTPSRLSATTQICMHRATLHTTPKNQADLQFLTFVLVTSQSNPPTIFQRLIS